MITEKLKASWDSEVDTLLSEEDSVNTEYRVLSGEHTQHMFCPRSSIEGGNRQGAVNRYTIIIAGTNGGGL